MLILIVIESRRKTSKRLRSRRRESRCCRPHPRWLKVEDSRHTITAAVAVHNSPDGLVKNSGRSRDRIKSLVLSIAEIDIGCFVAETRHCRHRSDGKVRPLTGAQSGQRGGSYPYSCRMRQPPRLARWCGPRPFVPAPRAAESAKSRHSRRAAVSGPIASARAYVMWIGKRSDLAAGCFNLRRCVSLSHKLTSKGEKRARLISRNSQNRVTNS
jgi:hypothetical protein